jgi:DNA-binding transcriptional LysR family regulator
MLDLNRLNTFKEVMDRRSFSAAAEALGYTQSSVSQQISVLERELGATLVDRATRPIRPTPAGSVVLSHADVLVGQALAVERELAALTRGESGLLRVGGFFTAWATFLPQAVAAFSAAHPAAQLELRQLELEPSLRALRAGDLDVAVVYRLDQLAKDPERFRWTHLLDDLYAVALPARHRLATAPSIALADLAVERWVSPPPGENYAELLRRLCQNHGGFTPQIGFQTEDIAMAQPLVAAGLAVALLPRLGLVPQQAGVVVRPLAAVPPARSVWAVEPRHRRTPGAAAMVQALRDATQGLEA